MRGAFAAGLRRLIGGANLAPEQLRLRQRLVGALMLSPVIFAGATAVVLPAVAGPALVVATACAAFALTWLAGLFVAQHGHEKPVALTVLVAAAVALPLLVAAGGGLASPVALLLGALAFEPWWIWRSRRAVQIGVAAMVLAGVGAAVASGAFSDALPHAWTWLPTGLYLLTILSRLSSDAREEKPTLLPLEERMGAAVLTVAANGDVLGGSARSSEILGLAPELVAGRALFERLHVSDRVAYMRALSEVRNGEASRSLDLRLRVPGDPDFDTYQPLLAEIVAAGGECQLILRPAGEIEELRRKLADVQDEVDKVGIAKSSFLASVSHELRTPLNAIIGFSDMLVHELYGSFPDSRQKEQVLLIRDAGTHLLAVVNSILDVSKIELGAYEINPEPFPLADAVTMCSAMMSVQAGAKDIKLEARVEPAVGEVNADRRAVQQMLINLVSNAIKFTPEGGRVSVESALDGDMVELVVRDTGIGIAEADIARVGQPFVQLSTDFARRYEGTGLGLALVKGLVRLHGGTMVVSSLLGSGTTVTIRLPKGMHDRSLPILDEEFDGAYRKTA